jgi:hypothetical protein
MPWNQLVKITRGCWPSRSATTGFFADDAYRTPDELVAGPSSSIIRRRLNDGSSYQLVKVPHRPSDLQDRLRRLGWDITVTATAGPFYWGAGHRG